MTDALLSAAAITPDSVVLDLASGSGDPALTIAERLIRGRVIALDSSRSGLLLASTHARQFDLGLKVTFVQGDAHAIPLLPSCVDRVTCRCGIMFFNNTGLVMSEVLRVLDPEDALRFWSGVRSSSHSSTPRSASCSGSFTGARMPRRSTRNVPVRCARGSLERALRTAGFRNVREEPLTVPRIWAGRAEELWAYQQEISTLCQPAVRQHSGRLPLEHRCGGRRFAVPVPEAAAS